MEQTGSEPSLSVTKKSTDKKTNIHTNTQLCFLFSKWFTSYTDNPGQYVQSNVLTVFVLVFLSCVCHVVNEIYLLLTYLLTNANCYGKCSQERYRSGNVPEIRHLASPWCFKTVYGASLHDADIHHPRLLPAVFYPGDLVDRRLRYPVLLATTALRARTPRERFPHF